MSFCFFGGGYISRGEPSLQNFEGVAHKMESDRLFFWDGGLGKKG